MPAPALIDPAALMRIKSLEMRARVVVEGFWKGLHKSPYHGFSVEFSEYRPYTKGDDPRFIDWKVVARSDRVFIKKFEDETNLRCTLLVDQSQSMGYGSKGYSKADYAATLAATLAYFLMEQGDAVGLATFDEKPDQAIPARNRPGHLRRLMVRLEQAPRGSGTDLIAPLRAISELITRRGVFVLISDLLAPIDDLEKHLGYLAAAGHDLVIFHTLDRAELEFTFDKATHFRDRETGRDLYIDPDVARAGYLKKLNAHLDALRGLCERNRIDYRLLPTDQPMELALFDFVRSRKDSGVAPARAVNRSNRV
ncbi:MAG: DUF58 domain-containing protein [Verrucomicrobiales bacterium]|nr:DUF58 domain-containing protein [Verrucomicrobiales bacterium]